MNIQELSKKYIVRIMQENDIPTVLELCSKNPQYYHFCPPQVSAESIAKDMVALPPGKTKEDKYYIGFWDNDILVAVMDLIVGFPNKETAFVGFFMMNVEYQGQGVGTSVIEETCETLKQEYRYVRLGYVKGNEQAEHFWKKNGFVPTGVVAQEELYEVVVLQKEL